MDVTMGVTTGVTMSVTIAVTAGGGAGGDIDDRGGFAVAELEENGDTFPPFP